MNYALYQSPLGWITLAEKDGALAELRFKKVNEVFSSTPLLQEAATQLDAYFSGRLQKFDLPLAPQGTPFQLRVWQELRNIPYGEVISYQELASWCGNLKACRAVGQANNRNPIAIIVPCHRVVGKSGKLVGYAGGLHLKQFLLDLEKGR